MVSPGWDGDDLAGQMEDAAERAQQSSSAEPNSSAHITVEERQRRDQLESLRLSHARTLDQLSRATNPTPRKMLEGALRSLEEKMKQYGASSA